MMPSTPLEYFEWGFGIALYAFAAWFILTHWQLIMAAVKHLGDRYWLWSSRIILDSPESSPRARREALKRLSERGLHLRRY